MPPALSPASSLPTWAKSGIVQMSKLTASLGCWRDNSDNSGTTRELTEEQWHLEPHLELSMILFNPSQGVISVCWLQSGGRNVSGLWPKIRSLFLRNLSLLSWWLNDRACIVLVHPGSAGRWLEDFLPGDIVWSLCCFEGSGAKRFNKRSYVLPVLCCPAFLSNSKDKI